MKTFFPLQSLQSKGLLPFFLFLLFSQCSLAQTEWEKRGDFVFVEGIAQMNGVLIISAPGAGLFRSTNNGDHWKRVETYPQVGSNMSFVFDFETIGNTLYAAEKNGIYKSQDAGETWIETAITTGQLNASRIDQIGTWLFVCTKNGLFRSGDGGQHWSKVESTLKGKEIASITSVKLGGTTHYFAGGPEGLYTSADDTKTWELVSTPSESIQSMGTKTDASLLIGTRKGIYESNDLGDSWTLLPFSFDVEPEYPYVEVKKLEYHGQTWLTLIDNAIWYSTDDGDNWTPLEHDFGVFVMAFTLLNEHLFVGTHGASLQYTTLDVPLSYPYGTGQLLQPNLEVYPNPANDILNINFVEKAFESNLEYEIFNMQSKSIRAGTINGGRTINVSDLQPGCYTLVVNNSSEMHKTQFIK